MKFKNKFLISLLIFCFGLILSRTAFAANAKKTMQIKVVKNQSTLYEASEIIADGFNIKDTGIEDKLKNKDGDTIAIVNVDNTTVWTEDEITFEGINAGKGNCTYEIEDEDGNSTEVTFEITVLEESEETEESEDSKIIKNIKIRAGERKKIFASNINEDSTDIKEISGWDETFVDVEDYDVVGTDYILITGMKKGKTTIKVEVELKGTQGTHSVHNITVEVVELEESDPREESTFVDILDNIDGYSKPGDLDAATSKKIEDAASIVLSAITSIGVVVAIVILAVLGLKYMLGSVEEKAEYKKDLIPYIVGAFLLFGISTFVKIFMQWGQTISNL